MANLRDMKVETMRQYLQEWSNMVAAGELALFNATR
jgi:hypothetical protein